MSTLSLALFLQEGDHFRAGLIEKGKADKTQEQRLRTTAQEVRACVTEKLVALPFLEETITQNINMNFCFRLTSLLSTWTKMLQWHMHCRTDERRGNKISTSSFKSSHATSVVGNWHAGQFSVSSWQSVLYMHARVCYSKEMSASHGCKRALFIAD